MITFGSLFAGIGGMDLGLERAGMKCLWQVEIDPYCRKVLAKHWPEVERFEDVREVGKHNLRAVDLICGGFPCQPVSCAGQKKGEADERWLWPDFARVIREVRPRWVIVENVRGLLNRGMSAVMLDLAVLRYAAEWDCLRASQFGARHRRERVFIVAYPDSDGLQGRRVLSQEGHVPTLDQVRDWPNVPEPFGIRSRHGVPRFVDRIRGIGNAVVPQVAEWIGRRIVEADRGTK